MDKITITNKELGQLIGFITQQTADGDWDCLLRAILWGELVMLAVTPALPYTPEEGMEHLNKTYTSERFELCRAINARRYMQFFFGDGSRDLTDPEVLAAVKAKLDDHELCNAWWRAHLNSEDTILAPIETLRLACAK